jgi:hypothetical protein
MSDARPTPGQQANGGPANHTNQVASVRDAGCVLARFVVIVRRSPDTR